MKTVLFKQTTRHVTALIICSTLTDASATTSLSEFYLHYQPVPQLADYASSIPTANPPQVRLITNGARQTPVDALVHLGTRGGFGSRYNTLMFGPTAVPSCKLEPTVIPNPTMTDSTISEVNAWRDSPDEGCGEHVFIGIGPVKWTVRDDVTFSAPTRRKALDGSEYEASAMKVLRGGEPWMTYFWGYRLGMVAGESNWSMSSLPNVPALSTWPKFPSNADNFELVALPPPLKEGEAIEYVNFQDFPRSPGGQYFYSTTTADREALDSGRAGKWERTGQRFNTGGYVSVCRFYGSVSPGPNTHFFTADANECKALRDLQVVPRPADRQQLNFEDIPFHASRPVLTALGANVCPTQSLPLYRAYNAAFGSTGRKNYDSNHRFSTRSEDILAMTKLGWIDEGVVMCVPK